jgi:hypothetical protein
MRNILVKYYILKDRVAVPVSSVKEWADFYENQKLRRIRFNTIKKYDIDISTVFLGLDHGYPQWAGHTENYKPQIFETMIFWEKHELNNWCDRYSTWDEAVKGHREAIRLVIKTLREPNDI